MITYIITFALLLVTPILNGASRGVELVPYTDLRYDLIAPRSDRTLVLSSPGNYKFSSGTVADFTSTTTIICITTSDVTLDLQNFTIAQKDADSSSSVITGIHIQDGVSNVLIKNGKINHINGKGIVIGLGCFNISIHNVLITQTKQTPLEIEPNANTIRINNCLVAKSTSVGQEYTGIKLTDNANVTIDHCSVIQLTGDTGYSCYGIFAKNCKNCSLKNSIVSGITGKHATGVVMNTCIDWIVENNESNGNIGRDGTSTGLCLVKSIANKIINFEASNNHGTDNGNGIQVRTSSHYNRFINCTTSNNYSSSTGNGYGIHITSGNSNFVSNMNSFANTGGTDDASEGAGIKIESTLGNLVENSKFDNNNGNSGNGYGILLQDSEQCIIENNTFYYNRGSSGSWGILEAGTASSFIASNIAFGNQTNFGVQQQTLNSIQNVLYNAPRSVQTSHRGNVNIVGS